MTDDGRMWSELVRRFSGPLTMFAAQWCSHPEDVVQEAFLELFRSESRPEKLSAWLFTVVKNKAIGQIRSEARRKNHEGRRAAVSDCWFEEPAYSELDIQLVSRLIDQLEHEQREVLIARMWGDLTFDEIAEFTQLTKSTCHRRYSEAIEVLRKQLGVSCPKTNS